MGFLAMTMPLAEFPNRIGNEGAKALAATLKVNSSLRCVILLHNHIFQEGIDHLRVTLCEEPCNRSLIKLELEQMGIPHNELSREDIRWALKRNYLALTEAERMEIDDVVNPKHVYEIASVYRVNGSYAGDFARQGALESATGVHDHESQEDAEWVARSAPVFSTLESDV
jgi:hypothetical protein